MRVNETVVFHELLLLFNFSVLFFAMHKYKIFFNAEDDLDIRPE